MVERELLGELGVSMSACRAFMVAMVAAALRAVASESHLLHLLLSASVASVASVAVRICFCPPPCTLTYTLHPRLATATLHPKP